MDVGQVYIPTVVEGEWESDYVFDDDSASTVIESTVEILGVSGDWALPGRQWG